MKKKANKATITVQGTEITIIHRQDEDFISLTDMVRGFDGGPALIEQWLKNKDTVLFLGVWEQLNNPDFKTLEFEGIKSDAGRNSFYLSAKKWMESTGARGLIAKAGRYGGTFAHRDIAFEFGSWLSPEFKLYLIKEFQRLKEDENRRLSLAWNLNRTLTNWKEVRSENTARERIVQTITELKKALMHKLFTEGLRNDPLKKTEIGPVPESWEGVELGDLNSVAHCGMSKNGNPEGNCPILLMTNQLNGRILANNLQFVEITASEFQKFKVERGEILFNHTHSLDLVGRTTIHAIEGDYVFANYLISIRTNEERLNTIFLNLDFNRDETQVRLKSIATRAVSQSNISATGLMRSPIPLPSLRGHADIVRCGAALDSKIKVYQAKLATLQDLLRTLLHELMTAKIRVPIISTMTIAR